MIIIMENNGLFFLFQAFSKLHKFFIPDSVSPSKLIKSITKELKKTEVCFHLVVVTVVVIREL